ncbi:MAG TPA: hypothetical protein VJQ52_12005 [Steroidobacteraceae bacterium]|nr:hypothetical protein [Steroidobacteraceae bacterium]
MDAALLQHQPSADESCAHLAQSVEILVRIAVDHDDVGQLADLDRAEDSSSWMYAPGM